MKMTLTFNETMNDLCDLMSRLKSEKDRIDGEIKCVRESIISTFSEYNRDEYRDHEKLTVTFKMRSSGERMKRGAKEQLRQILTPEQWSAIYTEPRESPVLVVKRKRRG